MFNALTDGLRTPPERRRVRLGPKWTSSPARWKTVNYSAGFDVVAMPAGAMPGGFHPVNIYLGYDFKDQGLLHDTTVSLNVDNLLDENPAFENVTGNIGDSGSTVGRFVNFGVHKKT